ncbi:MAG TPA: ATP-grasp domain-containing protein [Gemmataceae bacterium]|jgi:D-alanine-D-alanine ligase|nr:ATP-grasp domain-containing protein [Gemmataceae bacterium]
MRIGITYDLKAEGPGNIAAQGGGLADDLQEEFDSPATIEAIAAALRDLGHDVVKLGDGRELLERLLAQPPDLVFNIAEGQGVGRAREARVPAVLEMLGIPYTGSDPLTLAVTLDKDCAKRLAASAGVAVPRGIVIGPPLQIDNLPVAGCHLQFPVIVKPAWEGSSKGIRGTSVVERAADLDSAIRSLWHDHRQPVLVEEFIDGDELTVGVLGSDRPHVLGVMRVLPRQPTERFIYSLEVKRDFERQIRYECPARLSPTATEAVHGAALAVYGVLGCRDVSRVDFRLRGDVPYFLEVNPLPGLNPTSGDLVIMARLCGWSYPRLIQAILQAALARGQRSEVRSQ